MLDENAFRNTRLLVEIIQMRIGDELIQILKARLILYQNDLMHRADLFRVPPGQTGVDVFHARRAGIFLQAHQQILKNLGQNRRIIARAVMVERVELQIFGDRIELVVFDVLEHRTAHGQGVDVRVREIHSVAFGRGVHERGIERGVMRQQHRAFPAELVELPQGFLFGRSVLYHFVRDAGQLGDLGRNVHAGIYENIEAVGNLSVFDPYRTDFGHAVLLRAQAGGLNIERDKLIIQRVLRFAHQSRNHIVDKIRFDAVNDLEVRSLFADGRSGIHGVRVGLRHTVVGNGDGLMPPFGGAPDQIAHRGDAVHTGHRGMQMQLHTLFGRVVHHLEQLHRADSARAQHDFVVVLIVADFAAHQNGAALFQGIDRAALAVFLNEL